MTRSIESRIKKTFEETETWFHGEYKGYTIEIELEEDEVDYKSCYGPDIVKSFYVRVYNPEISFGTVCDGYAPEEIETMREAKAFALMASGLVETPAS